MSKKCVCGNEMFTVFMCRKCEHLLYVEEDEDFPQKLGKIAAKACPCCGEQDEGLWRLLGRAEGFEGTIFVEDDAVRELLNAFGALAEMSLNFYRALLNAGATKEEAFVLLQSFISATIHGNKEKSDED